ncbi:MAG TPA: DUF4345 domain-containing protein [Allosphingosinicella sp.]|nr:DUF4345 domain-containing protein [Allosphingosinicella sp.]
MELRWERRLLQAVVGLACLVPLWAGLAGIALGPAMAGGPDATAASLDSHFRYLSGLLLGIGLAFAACIPRIERAGAVYATLSAIVIMGGLARLLALLLHGAPGGGHVFGLAMELGAVPLLLLWQRSLAARWASPGDGAAPAA